MPISFSIGQEIKQKVGNCLHVSAVVKHKRQTSGTNPLFPEADEIFVPRNEFLSRLLIKFHSFFFFIFSILLNGSVYFIQTIRWSSCSTHTLIRVGNDWFQQSCSIQLACWSWLWIKLQSQAIHCNTSQFIQSIIQYIQINSLRNWKYHYVDSNFPFDRYLKPFDSIYVNII